MSNISFYKAKETFMHKRSMNINAVHAVHAGLGDKNPKLRK